MNVTVGDNLNLPDLINAAISPDRRGSNTTNKNGQKGNKQTHKNVAILSDNWTSPTTGMNHNDPGFLSDSFPRNPPKLYITAESDDFDAQTLSDWSAEGFDVSYIPLGDDVSSYLDKLRSLHRSKSLGPCEIFGIVAFGEAASVCLEHYHVLDHNSELKMGLLVAYYPTRIPDPGTRFPSAIRVVVHLATGEIGVVKQSQMVGIQGKKRVVKQRVDRGVGLGGVLAMGYKGYAYEVEPGFAEHDLDEYDGICAELAWYRSLSLARRAFRVEKDVEGLVDLNSQGKFYTGDVQQTMSTYTTQKVPQVTYVSTLSGGTGSAALEQFYHEYFINANPPSLETTLLSRTVGIDRVVDEIYLSFKHTQDMPWILPGVPPTNKRVEIVLVSIVALRCGKLHHEHVYWDQASVLVQVGLLDPNVVPETARNKGVNRLPVVGRKAARWVYGGGEGDEDVENELIHAWEDDEDEDDEDYESDNDHEGSNEAEAEKTLPERPKSSNTQNGMKYEESEGEKGKQVSGSENKNGVSKEHETKHATVEDSLSPVPS